MIRLKILFLITTLLFVFACSKETMKRTGYETLQNIREQECSRTPSVDCEQRERMEVYEERREEVESGAE